MSVHERFFELMAGPAFRHSHGQQHNRTDQELHYHIVHAPSGATYDYHGSHYDDEGLAKAVRWMESQ